MSLVPFQALLTEVWVRDCVLRGMGNPIDLGVPTQPIFG
ncbi:hypothetical protein RCH07_003812, partial [Arthrobacter sp. CG_A4]|nr:hypothetical protein [Arthrobacter sp. CG_A4]